MQRCIQARARKTADQTPTALVLGLFPAWLASEGDWPKQLRLLDFPLTDQAAGGYERDAGAALQQLPPALREFVADAKRDGAPVYVFALGSAPPPYAAAVFATAVEACGMLSARAVLLCSVDAVVPAPLPAHAHHATYAPFSALLQHAAAFCFNGGVGGVSQALRAGVPQVRARG
jgi:UDP:flavonoid glycosyltransferase YjiC (YdhE family)